MRAWGLGCGPYVGIKRTSTWRCHAAEELFVLGGGCSPGRGCAVWVGWLAIGVSSGRDGQLGFLV